MRVGRFGYALRIVSWVTIRSILLSRTLVNLRSSYALSFSMCRAVGSSLSMGEGSQLRTMWSCVPQ